MAAELFTHMPSYWASVSAMAARFRPSRLVANNCASAIRLALTSEGCTTVASVEPNAAAATCADAASCWHCWAVARSQVRYGLMAPTIAAEDGPRQTSVNADNTGS